jgi:predicted AAA+ superfamily ATPase
MNKSRQTQRRKSSKVLPARHDIKNTRALRELALYYMSNAATLASFNKLKTSLGLGSVTTVSAYTDALVQNVVFVELLRRGVDVSYYRTMSGREVDFACHHGRALSELVQVTLSLADPRVRQRELDTMTEAMEEQKLDVGMVLTESEHEDVVSGPPAGSRNGSSLPRSSVSSSAACQ